MSEVQKYEIVITSIVVKDGKYLITRRSPSRKKWPGKWTVPGGHLEVDDYVNSPKDSVNAWYNVLEKAVKREVKEEVGILIKNIQYVTSIIAQYGDKISDSLIISVMADYDSGEVQLQEEETDKFEWVSLEEAKNYDLIDGIYDELVMADNLRKGIKSEWKRTDSAK